MEKMQKKIAVIFPGQGSQRKGMLKELYSAYKKVKEVVDEACEVLEYNIKDIMFYDKNNELMKTLYTQPAVFVSNHALSVLAKSLGLEYNTLAGHSVGEYNALLEAGVATYEDALKIIKERAKLMSGVIEKYKINGKDDITPMLAVIYREGKEENFEKAQELCNEVNSRKEKNGKIYIANYNSPKQVVIAGNPYTLEEVNKKLKMEKYILKTKFLRVEGPFHTPYMEEASQKMREYLDSIKIKLPEKKIVYNITGEFQELKNTDELKNMIAKQIMLPVKWYDVIKTLIREVNSIIEISYSPVLSTMLKRDYKDMIRDKVEVKHIREIL